ncbi:gamma-glutamylcyclotransferase family protein [Streptomyces sp. NPDC088747]|uniref:gamma-glutamylcyclotransferase family protein n=1 Tax=Streptomyces sp. NPDC088747 TaxID=3365886 RepID=UPI0037FFCC2F
MNRFSQDLDVLFVYGTLQFDAVLNALLGRIPEQVPPFAPGSRAAKLKGRVYPGLVYAGGRSAPGAVLLYLGNDEWRILDAFEDEHYELQEVPLSNGKLEWAYVWPGGDVQAAVWSASEFEDHHLEEYAARCARIAPGLAVGEPKSEYMPARRTAASPR